LPTAVGQFSESQVYFIMLLF